MNDLEEMLDAIGFDRRRCVPQTSLLGKRLKLPMTFSWMPPGTFSRGSPRQEEGRRLRRELHMRAGQEGSLSEGDDAGGQRLGAIRHARQRLGVVCRLVRRRLVRRPALAGFVLPL